MSPVSAATTETRISAAANFSTAMNMFQENSCSCRRMSDSAQKDCRCSARQRHRRSSSLVGISRRQSWSHLAVVSLALLSTTTIRNTHCSQESAASQQPRLPADLISQTADVGSHKSASHHGGLHQTSSYRTILTTSKQKGLHHQRGNTLFLPQTDDALMSNEWPYTHAALHHHHPFHLSKDAIGRRSETSGPSGENEWRKGTVSRSSSTRWHPTTSLLSADMSPLASAFTGNDKSADWLPEQLQGKTSEMRHSASPPHHSRIHPDSASSYFPASSLPLVDTEKVENGSNQEKKHRKRQATNSLLQQTQENVSFSHFPTRIYSIASMAFQFCREVALIFFFHSLLCR